MEQFRVVLVSTIYPGNLGAIARVAANFDTKDVVLVNPLCSPQDANAIRYAVNRSRETLQDFQIKGSLHEALTDTALSIAFSRKDDPSFRRSLSFDEFLEKIQNTSGKIALVFGKEDHGLSNDDVRLCNFECAIPTSEQMYSMNLSHSVAVILSALFRQNLKKPNASICNAPAPVLELDFPASHDEVTALAQHFREVVEQDAAIAFSKDQDRLLKNIEMPLRRAQLSKREVGHYRTFLSKIQNAIKLQNPS